MPHFAAADGTRLFYRDQGAGVPVLALAGLTRNGGDFDHIAPHLPCRLIRPDYRGRGQSDWADPATYTIPQEGADALALMDHLGIEKAAVLGTSRGGLIAMMLAATTRTRLLGVALNDIGPEIATDGLKVIENYIGRNPAQKTYEEAAKFRDKFWGHFKNVPMSRWLAEVANHYQETADGLTIRYDPKLRDAVFGNAKVQPAPDLWPLYAALEGLPLCLLRGANSDLLTPDTWGRMLAERPDAIAVEIPDRGHVPFLDEPEAIAALNEWITQL